MEPTNKPTTAALRRSPGSAAELGDLLGRMAREGGAAVVEWHGRLFRVEPQPIALAVAAQRVRAVLHATAGGYRGIDRTTFDQIIRGEREQDSRGRPA
jgi:hypothetical protein